MVKFWINQVAFYERQKRFNHGMLNDKVSFHFLSAFHLGLALQQWRTPDLCTNPYCSYYNYLMGSWLAINSEQETICIVFTHPSPNPSVSQNIA